MAQRCLAFSCGLEKNDSNALGVDAHFFFFFLKHGDKFLCFQKYPDTCGLGLKPAFCCTKTPFMCERKAGTEKKISVFKILLPDTCG